MGLKKGGVPRQVGTERANPCERGSRYSLCCLIIGRCERGSTPRYLVIGWVPSAHHPLPLLLLVIVVIGVGMGWLVVTLPHPSTRAGPRVMWVRGTSLGPSSSTFGDEVALQLNGELQWRSMGR